MIESTKPAGRKPVGTLQIDVDDLWVYYESIGRTMPADAEAIAFTQGIPRLLDLFDRYGVRATFFVCGQDLPAQRATIFEMVRRGHEVANHSAEHLNGYARLSHEALRQDVREAHEKIGDAAGRAPVGFKAPGFSYNPRLPEVLGGLGYKYDSSQLPTFYAGPIRALQQVLSRGKVDPTHYGRFRYGFTSLRPHPLDAAPWSDASPQGEGLLEVPVTTVTLFRLPMHSTFVLTAGRWLFDLGLGMTRAFGLPINYLLHAADVVDPVSDPALSSYHFLVQTWEAKQPLYEYMIRQLAESYVIVPTQEFVQF